MLHGEVIMTGSGPAVVSQAMQAANKPETEVFDTRFGKITVSHKNPIVFPNGLLGIPDKSNFCLTNFPSEKMARFKLLQSLEDSALSFITLPLDVQNPIYETVDMEQACKDLSVPANELTLLLIVSVHREASGVKLSVNARAPIMVHASKRTASQYVFASNKYNIRHMLSL
jgi:flagellar assembly factor FliW